MRQLLLSLLVIGIISINIFAGGPSNGTSNVKAKLTAHKWTLVEVIQGKSDSAANITEFMIPCEKDRQLQFNGANNTYKIVSTQEACNKDNKDESGKWTGFNEKDSSFFDELEGGVEVKKKITSINDEVLVLTYEVESKHFKQTYFSETGKKNEANTDLVVDSSDIAKVIMRDVAYYLKNTNRFNLIYYRDLLAAQPVSFASGGGMLPAVALAPMIDGTQTNPIKAETRDPELIEKAKKCGATYLITGILIEANANPAKDGNFGSSIQYEIVVYNVATGAPFRKKFNKNSKDAADKTERTFKTLAIIGAVSDIAGSVPHPGPGGFGFHGGYHYGYSYGYRPSGYHPGYYYSRPGYYGLSSYYAHAMVLNAASSTARSMSAIYSISNNEEREIYYAASVSKRQAYALTQKELREFITEKVPVRIKINNIDGTGKKATVKIEAGSNIYLQKGEILKVVKIETTTLNNGNSVSEQTEIGEIQVDQVTADLLSNCSINSGAGKIIDEQTKNAAGVWVLTTGKVKRVR